MQEFERDYNEMFDTTKINDFDLGGKEVKGMDAATARAKVIKNLTAAPGATFTLLDFTQARMDIYGQSREWGRELLDEMVAGELISLVRDVEDGPSYVVTDSSYIIDQWRTK